jgi:hypothetical protein
MRVYEIAKELGIDSKRVVACLADAGRFVRSASSTLSPDDVRLVREKFGNPTTTTTAAPTVPTWLTPATGTDPRDEVAADAAALFGPAAAATVRRRTGTQNKPARPRPKTPRPAPPLPTGRPVTAADRRAAEREQKSIQEWSTHMIDPVERRAWIDAGLGQDDVRLAEHCLSYGLTPAHLGIRVDGIRAGDRIRGGEAVGSVVARLREGGHIAATA